MQKWEYLIARFEMYRSGDTWGDWHFIYCDPVKYITNDLQMKSRKDPTHFLNFLGQEGWEMTSMSNFGKYGSECDLIVCSFKRAIED